MLALHQIGITDDQSEIDHSKTKSIRDLIASFVDNAAAKPEDHAEALDKAYIFDPDDRELAAKLLSKISNTDDHVDILNSWKFFEFFNGERLIAAAVKTPLDALSAISLEKMSYADGERDLIVMKHIFQIETRDKELKELHSTMVLTGDPIGSGGLSCMGKSVGYSAGIATKCVLEGKFEATGVVGPRTKEIYQPILNMLEDEGIQVVEEYK